MMPKTDGRDRAGTLPDEYGFKTCDGRHERHGQPHSLLDESLAGHRLHCPVCDVHLTSLMLCPNCGTRFGSEFVGVELEPGLVAHVALGTSAATLEALRELGHLALEQLEQEGELGDDRS